MLLWTTVMVMVFTLGYNLLIWDWVFPPIPSVGYSYGPSSAVPAALN